MWWLPPIKGKNVRLFKWLKLGCPKNLSLTVAGIFSSYMSSEDWKLKSHTELKPRSKKSRIMSSVLRVFMGNFFCSTLLGSRKNLCAQEIPPIISWHKKSKKKGNLLNHGELSLWASAVFHRADILYQRGWSSLLTPRSYHWQWDATGMSDVSQFFASGSTAKTDHKSDELMLHNDRPKNLQDICAYTSR
jgi:hypothetical protein